MNLAPPFCHSKCRAHQCRSIDKSTAQGCVESLSYSYEQRALHHQAALNLALEMENAGRRIRDRHQPTSEKTIELEGKLMGKQKLLGYCGQIR
jgi:hypothetical protein